MLVSGFGRVIHDRKYFEVEISIIFLQFITYLRAHHKIVENYQFNIILSYIRQISRTYLHTIYNIF